MIYACKLYITTKQMHVLTVLGIYLKHPAKITIFKTRPYFQHITQCSKALT